MDGGDDGGNHRDVVDETDRDHRVGDEVDGAYEIEQGS